MSPTAKTLIFASLSVLLLGLAVLVFVPPGQLQIIRFQQSSAVIAASILYLALLAHALSLLAPHRPFGQLIAPLTLTSTCFAVAHGDVSFFFQLGGIPGLPYLPHNYLGPIIIGAAAYLLLLFLTLVSLPWLARRLPPLLKRLSAILLPFAGILVLFHALLIGTHFQDLKSPTVVTFFSGTAILFFLYALYFDRRLFRASPRIFTLTCCFLLGAVGYRYFSHPPLASPHPHASHSSTHLPSAPPSARYNASFSASPPHPQPGQTVLLQFTVYDSATGFPVVLFAKNYEHYAHLIIVDQTLTDYQHLHPALDNGVFSITTKFASAGRHHLYLDLLPLGAAEQHFAFTLPVGSESSSAQWSPRPPAPSLDFANVRLTLTSPPTISAQKLTANQQTLQFTLTDLSGRPLTNLQPYLGAFAHLVLINTQTYQYLHAHPTGISKLTSQSRGGPRLSFQPSSPFGPISAGSYSAFLQIHPGDNLLTIPFTITIHP